jgi:hypothetical protein
VAALTFTLRDLQIFVSKEGGASGSGPRLAIYHK